MKILVRIAFCFITCFGPFLCGAAPVQKPKLILVREHFEAQTCKAFMKHMSRLSVLRQRWNFNVPETRRAIDAVSGGRFNSGEVTFAPPAPVEAEKNSDGSSKAAENAWLKLVESWFNDYDKYPLQMMNYIRALGRYEGEFISGHVLESANRDSEIDRLRKKGRIAILEEALEQLRNRQSRLSSNAEGEPQALFPIKIRLPRAPLRNGKSVEDEQGGSILVDLNVFSIKDLEETIANDLRESQLLKKFSVEREIRQAVLAYKITLFRAAFSDDIVRQIEDRFAARDGGSQAALNKKLELIRRADSILRSDLPEFIVKRPTERSLELISKTIGSASHVGALHLRHWEMRMRAFGRWASGWMKWFNKRTTELRQPWILYAGFVAVASSFSTLGIWMHVSMKRQVFELLKDEVAIRRQAYIDEAQDLRNRLGVIVREHEPFYVGLNDEGQKKYRDESVYVAWHFMLGFRDKPTPYEHLDPHIPKDLFDGISREAAKFVDEVRSQEFGVVDENGVLVVAPTGPRIPLREENLRLARMRAAQVSAREKNEHGWNSAKYTNSVPPAPDAPKEGPVKLPSFK